MPERPGASRQLSLSERLQGVTEALAATRTPAEVFGVVLHPALQALGAVAGVVLLVNDRGDRLEVAATQGYAEGEQTLWQSGALDDVAPAIDALRRREPVYFEHQAALTAAYPDLAAPPGGVAVVATAVTPMVLDGQALGVIVLAFTEPHLFAPEERRFLETLAAQCALALDRLQLAAQLRQQAQEVQTHADTLSAFVALTEAVGTETDLEVLILRATQVIQAVLPGLGVAYYEPEGGLWKARGVSEEVAPEMASLLRAGLPLDTPSYAAAVQAGGPVFADAWDADTQGVAHSESYGAGAFYPYFRQGEPSGMFVIGTQRTRAWTTRDRAMFTAVGRSLGLALERASQAALLQAQNAELAARTNALDGFAALTRELAVQRDPAALIRRAQEVVMSLLPPGYVLFWERQGERWIATAQVNDVGSPQLQLIIDQGLLIGQTPTLDTPYARQEPDFQDVYAQGADTSADVVRHIGATACLPLVVGDEVSGILAVALFETRSWSRSDRAVLTTVAQSLGLALERAQGLLALAARSQELERSNEQLEVANGELEAFAYSVSHDLQTPVRHIKGFNDLLRQVLGTHADAKVTRYLGIVDEAAARMNTLIDALLALSRTSRQPLRIGPVNLATLVASTCLEVEADAQGRPVEWAVQPLPLVKGDQDTLRQVMVNLLSNALKYSRPAPQAVIEVWAEERPGEWVVFVRDNGVGFDPRYQDRLFGVFQRLHRQEDFEGIGVGLVNVQRIIARHGGTVFAHSGGGPGATFGFTLPRPP